MAITFLTPAVFTFDSDGDDRGATPGTYVLLAGFYRALVPRDLVMTTALSGIYQTALYHYAADREVPQEFAGADLAGAFPPKHR